MYQRGRCIWLFVLFLIPHVAFAQRFTPRDTSRLPEAPWVTVPTSTEKKAMRRVPKHRFNPELAHSWGNCLVADVWVVVDYSGSIEGYELYISDALKEINVGLLSEPSFRRMGIISFDEKTKLIQSLSSSYDEVLTSIESFEEVIANGGTSINNGLLAAQTMQQGTRLNHEANNPEFKKILILISDGQDSNTEKILETSRKLKNDDWWIYSVMTSQVGYPKEKTPARDAILKNYNLLKDVSGNPTNKESSYIDFILLEDLSKYFREHFMCS